MVAVEISSASSILQVYPNPAVGEISIAWAVAEEAETPMVGVYSVTGARLSVTPVRSAGGTWTLDVAELPAGMYVVELRSGARVAVGRFRRL